MEDRQMRVKKGDESTGLVMLSPQGMLRRAHGSYRESASREGSETQVPGGLQAEARGQSGQGTVGGIPHAQVFGLTDFYCLNSMIPGPRYPLLGSESSGFSWKSWRATGICAALGGSGLHNPESPRMTDTNCTSTSTTDHHLVHSFLQLVFPSPLVTLISLKDKLQQHVISHWCSICLSSFLYLSDGSNQVNHDSSIIAETHPSPGSAGIWKHEARG